MTVNSELSQSNSAIKRQANQKNFGGKTSDFKDNQERHFNQRMLKAYLKGGKSFAFGFHPEINLVTGKKDPIYHDVLMTDKTVDANALDKLLANGYTDPGKVFGGVTISKKALRKKISKLIKSKTK